MTIDDEVLDVSVYFYLERPRGDPLLNAGTLDDPKNLGGRTASHHF